MSEIDWSQYRWLQKVTWRVDGCKFRAIWVWRKTQLRPMVAGSKNT
jgi:hypothetical protein